MADVNGISPEPTSSAPQSSSQAPPPTHPPTTSTHPTFPTTSTQDIGLSKRPRDARLIHMILAHMGVTAYQDRVPLQLLDFAYRYTSSSLQDAIHLTSESYGTIASGLSRGAAIAGNDMSSITPLSLRLSIASRTHYQFSPNLPKEFYQDLAQERNRIALPSLGKDWGVRLPPERYCLTGVVWGLQDEWDSEGETEGERAGDSGDLVMGEGAEGDRGEEGDERMNDIFGEDFVRGDYDKDMGE